MRCACDDKYLRIGFISFLIAGVFFAFGIPLFLTTHNPSKTAGLLLQCFGGMALCFTIGFCLSANNCSCMQAFCNSLQLCCSRCPQQCADTCCGCCLRPAEMEAGETPEEGSTCACRRQDGDQPGSGFISSCLCCCEEDQESVFGEEIRAISITRIQPSSTVSGRLPQEGITGSPTQTNNFTTVHGGPPSYHIVMLEPTYLIPPQEAPPSYDDVMKNV